MAAQRNRVQVMLSDDVFEKLRQVASEDRRTVSEYLRILIENHLEEK